jgi:ribonucleotide monophosphatase NagD (HAD superfamily)
MCINKKEKTIAIGDNLKTDIKGANNMKIDSLFISNGVHRSEFKKESELIELFNRHEVKPDYYQPELIW